MALTRLNVPVKHPSLVESVYETLLEAIVSGQLSPDDELNTVLLAGQLEVSRTPVTEAIKLLVHDGVVEQINGRRARVARFSRQEITDIYEVRKLFEAAAAGKAAKRIDAETRNAIRREAQQLLQSRDDVDWTARVIDFDIRFHDTLAAACGNERMRKEIARYRLLVRAFCMVTGDEETLSTALKEHIAILDALQSGCAAAARDAMATHIDARLQAVLQVVPQPSDNSRNVSCPTCSATDQQCEPF